MRAFLLICLATLAARSACAEDLFLGVFESETRENFGSGTAGEYRLEVVAAAGNKYAATIYHRGEVLERQELFRCPAEREEYFRGRPPGRAEVLCVDLGSGTHLAALSYSENGILAPAVKSKYASNPELVKQAGLEPADPSLLEARHYKAKYYGHFSWFVFGFRKVSP